jgi:hypothetical protein
MRQNEIILALQICFNKLSQCLDGVKSELFFHKEKDEVWSIAENVQHITMTFLPINNLLKSPELIIQSYGHSGRKSREMDTFTADYYNATKDEPWKTFPPFTPKLENESINYPKLHYSDNQQKIDKFYQFTGTQIAELPNKFPILSTSKEEDITNFLLMQSKGLLQLSATFTDEQMDDLQLPLPYIGLITLKEMLFFTIYHTNSHTIKIKELVGNWNDEKKGIR